MLKRSSGSVKVFYRLYSREQLLKRLREAIPALVGQLPVRRVVLFGSWATDRATAFSDVDLLVVYAGTPRLDAYDVVRRVFDVRGIEPHIYAEAEAERLSPILNRMTSSGIDLLKGSDQLSHLRLPNT